MWIYSLFYMNNTNDNMHMLAQISPFILYSKRTDYNVISHLLNVGILECFVLSCPILYV